MNKIVNYSVQFLKYTGESFKEYFRGLVPRTRKTCHTDPQCKKRLNITKTWMGKEISDEQFVLDGIDEVRIRLEKQNLPRIQKIIKEYEEERGEIIVDKKQ